MSHSDSNLSALQRADAILRDENRRQAGIAPDTGIAEERRPVDWDADIRMKRDRFRREQPWRRLTTSSKVKLNRKLRALIQLTAHGAFDGTAPTAISLEGAGHICHFQLRALRRLQQSDIFMNALREAQSHAEAIRRARARSAPPVQSAAPASDAPMIPAPAERWPTAGYDAPPVPMMIEVNPADEREWVYGDHGVRVASTMGCSPAASRPMPVAGDCTASFRMQPSPGFDTGHAVQRPHVIQAAPRRSLRRK